MEDGFGDGDRVPFGPLYSWFFIMNYISTPLKLVEQHDVSNWKTFISKKNAHTKTERLGNLVADAFHLHGFSPNPAPGPASRAWPTFESFPCVFEVAKRLLFRHLSGMGGVGTPEGERLGWYLFPAKEGPRKIGSFGCQVFFVVKVEGFFFKLNTKKKNITSQVYILCVRVYQWHICVAMYFTIVARSGKQQYTSTTTSGIFKIVSMMTCRCGPLPRVWLRSCFQFFAGPVQKFAQCRLTS